MISRNHEKVCTTLNYIEHFLILSPRITGCISISALAYFLGIPIGITSPAIGLKICKIATRIKKHSSIIKKKKNHDKMLFLEKSKLDSIEVLSSKGLIDSSISYDE